MTRTLDREAFRRCLAPELWEQDELGEDIPDSEWTTTVGEVLALDAPAASGSTIDRQAEGGTGLTGDSLS